MIDRERTSAEASSVPTTAQSDPALFARVLVAVDGSAPPAVLLRQARTLGGPDARLTIQGVLWRADIGASRIGDRRAEEAAVALDEATDAARQAGIDVEVAPEPASEPAVFVRERARSHHLLVTGAPPESLAAGAFLQTVAAGAAHHLPVPLLIARRESGAHPFPQRILIASDGTVESDWVVQMGAAVARRHDGRVTLVHVESHDDRDAVERVLSQAAGLQEALGVEPIVHVEEGLAHRLICEVAARERLSLAVLGSRRLAGVRALGSVSERVAHRAPCSVLTLPPEHLRP